MVESTREAKERELGKLVGKLQSLEAVLEEKKDLQAALVERVVSEHLLGLVMDDSSCLNPFFVRELHEKFVRTTHRRSPFYR